jgi:hypothetical protein
MRKHQQGVIFGVAMEIRKSVQGLADDIVDKGGAVDVYFSCITGIECPWKIHGDNRHRHRVTQKPIPNLPHPEKVACVDLSGQNDLGSPVMTPQSDGLATL